MEVELCEGLERIDGYSFKECKSLKRFKIPSTVNRVGEAAFFGCDQLISVEVCGGVMKFGDNSFQNCSSLRNIALSPESQVSLGRFGLRCHDLMKLFGSHNLRYSVRQYACNALKSRFDGLPIHRLCYYQSYCPSQVIIDQLRYTTAEQSESLFIKQDCLGMTPLHILACSTNQNLELYQFIVAAFPKSLITEDEWGCRPFFYAIWGDAPQEIVQFMIDTHKSAFPNQAMDWDKMVETLCRAGGVARYCQRVAGASLDVIKRLLQIHQTFFSEQSVNWQKAARELTIRVLVTCDYSEFDDDDDSGANEEVDWVFEDFVAMMEALVAHKVHQELIQCLQDIQQKFFPNQNDSRLQLVCEDLVKPLTGWWMPQSTYDSTLWFQFLAKCSIAERLNVIGVRKWRLRVKKMVEDISSDNNDWDSKEHTFKSYFDTVHSKLVTYEAEYQLLKETAFLLELVIWKSKIDESMYGHLDDDSAADLRGQCRINCGADIIIPNVLPYLIGNKKKAKHQ